MKRAALLLLAVGACATAPVADTRPASGPTGPVTDGAVTTADVNGIRIIVKRTPGAEFVAGQLYLLGGVRNWTDKDAGTESLAMTVASRGGTQKLDKDAYARKLAALGAEVGGGTTNDFSMLSCKSPKAGWDDTFGMMADALLTPALPAAELEIARARALSGLRHEQENPDGRLGYLSHMQLFAGHPYANRAVGTPETVAAVKLESLAPALARLRETSRMVLVVVGDVDAAHVIEQARAAFGALPRGSYVSTPLPPLSPSAPKLATEERRLPTNYVQAVFAAPGWKDADLPAAMVGINLLSDRLFEEVRTKRNLSYSPGANLRAASADPTGFLYVTAVDANQTFGVMLDEVKKLQAAPPTEKDLAGAKSLFLTGILMGNETVDGQAGLLGRALIFGGDWHLAATLPERIRAVTAAEVQTFAKTRITKLQTVVLGDPSKVNPQLFQSL